jgi:putative intracellular protease/amidase
VRASPAPLKMGVVLFTGFNLLDMVGPVEMLAGLGDCVRFTVLAESPGAIRSAEGPECVADTAIAGAEGIDVLLVPGGSGTRREVANEPLLAELRRLSATARFVATVCTGSALLARSGVLDGKQATTNKRAFAWATSQGPKVRWVAEARWVEDGKFFTSSGVSAGMDMALGLVARIADRETSLEIANRTEYAWHEDKGWDPFAKLNGLA